MKQCTQTGFQFEEHFSRDIVARFDGGALTSDAGALLLRQADKRIGLLDRLAQCFADQRKPRLVQHSVREMVAQRVYGLALAMEISASMTSCESTHCPAC